MPLSHKRNAGGCFSFRWWSLEKSTTTHKRTYLLYVRVTAFKGEREKRKKGFRRLHPCCLSFVLLSLYKNNSLKKWCTIPLLLSCPIPFSLPAVSLYFLCERKPEVRRRKRPISTEKIKLSKCPRHLKKNIGKGTFFGTQVDPHHGVF